MGIRFYCPRGHKLNVKSFLAGKTGYCPHCHARVEIPLESTRESSRSGKKTGEEADDEPVHDIPLAQPAPAEHLTGEVPVAKPVMPSTSSSPQTPAGQTPASVPAANQPATSQPGMNQPAVNQPAVSPAVPAPSAAEQPVVAATDPLAESPHAVWYVRPVTGGQYGPAAADVMRQWLDEGRVAADSLVWREGWPDWRPAATTFPKFLD
ncbi:MAG: GYF domain-containing protein [Planctomycetota bacterium]|nr:GYF domain-containing protein [Planctomycetota bacterium]